MKSKIENIIFNISEILKNSIPYKDYDFILIYFIFIKYIVDNQNADNKAISNLKSMFENINIDKNILIEANVAIEQKYNLQEKLLSDFVEEHINSHNFNNSYNNIFNALLNSLNEICFNNMGIEIVEKLKKFLYLTSYENPKLMSDKIINKSLCVLIKEILDVKNDDYYSDFTFRVGFPTLEINKNINCCITGYELNRSFIAIAQMLMIMSEKSNFKIKMVDILNDKITQNKFNKIVAIPPLGIKIKNLNSNHEIISIFGLPVRQISIEALTILKAISSLKDDGTAVITVSQSFLFSNNIMEREVRNLLVDNYLHTIMFLPSLYYGTNSATILLVLKKANKNNNILFIDASNNNYFNFSKKVSKPITELSDEAINKISKIYNNRQIIEGISNVVNISTIQENKYIFSLSKYIKTSEKNEFISNSEIDKRLNILYKQAENIIKNRFF